MIVTVGTTIGGYTEIGDDAKIGFNSTIKNRLRVGKGALIGMGAVVTKNVDDGATVIGNPAKPFVKE